MNKRRFCTEKMEMWWKGTREMGEAVVAPGRNDRRKVIHSFKVGAALTVASSLCLFEPALGKNSLWAVLTVVIVLEFTAGATLYKGFNRGMGTLAAVGLAVLAQIVANHMGHLSRAICISFSVFLIGACTTYMRFVPTIKKHYDYGAIVFLLTFILITVGSYYDKNVLHSSIERLYTIAIGSVICIITSLFILPIWSGEELHGSITSKFEDLAKLIQACVDDYFQDPNAKDLSKSSEDASLEDSYEELFHLDVAEESLATFASWEPRHSRFCYPWKQYVHLGVVFRHLAYTAFALHGCIDTHIQAPQSVRALFKGPCEHLAEEIVKILLQLAEAIKTHHQFSTHISDHLHEALQELDTSIKSQPQLFLTSNPSQKMEAFKEFLQYQTKKNIQIKQVGEKVISRTTSKAVITCLDFSEALPFAAFVSLLVETVARLDRVIEEVEELAKMAHFKEFHEENEIKITITKDSEDVRKIANNLKHEEDKEISITKDSEDVKKISKNLKHEEDKEISITKDFEDVKKISKNLKQEEDKVIMGKKLQYLLSNHRWCNMIHFPRPCIKGVA